MSLRAGTFGFDPEALASALLPFPEAQAEPLGLAEYRDFYDLQLPPDTRHRMGRVRVRGADVVVQLIEPATPRGSLIAIHGLFDHGGLWRHQVRWALSRRLTVCLLDLPGHGLSAGARAHVESFEHYVDALEAAFAVVRDRLPAPVLGLGHSTGCSVLMQAVLDDARRALVLDDLILLAPLVRPVGDRIGRPLVPILAPLLKRIPRLVYGNTSDAAYNRFMKESDPLQARHLSLGWVRAMATWSAAFDAHAPSPLSPCVIQGTRDRVVDWRGNLPRIEDQFAAPRVELLDDARHNLVNELEAYRRRIEEILDHRLDAL